MGGACSSHASTSTAPLTAASASSPQSPHNGTPFKPGTPGGSKPGHPPGPGFKAGSRPSELRVLSPRGGPMNSNGTSPSVSGRHSSRSIHSIDVTPVKDDALASAVERAASDGPSVASACKSLGDYLRTSLVDAGNNKQALHRRWATQKPGVMLARCQALVGAVDALLTPVADHVDADVNDANAGETWAEIELTGLLKRVQVAVRAVAGEEAKPGEEGGMGFAEVIGALCDILGALWECRREGMPFLTSSVDARASFSSAAADRILSMAAVILCRRVALETQDAFRKVHADLAAVLAAVGFAEPAKLAPMVRCPGKALLLYVRQVAERGESKACVRVRRRRAFWDAVEGVLREAAGGGTSAGEGNLGETAAFIAGTQLPSLPSSPAFSSPGPAGLPGTWNGGTPVGSPRGGEGSHFGVSWKLFPQFVAEGWNSGSVEEGEGHGPRKEFFTLAGADMCGRGHVAVADVGAGNQEEASEGGKALPSLFVYNREAGAEWFNLKLAQSRRLEAAYRYAGWLMGQAMNNRCELDVRLPRVLFKRLLQGSRFSPTMELLQEFDPDAARGIRQVETLSDADFTAMVQLEGLSKNTTRRAYVQKSVEDVLVTNVAWQFDALRAGFRLAMRQDELNTFGVTDEDLHEIVCGRSASRAAGAPEEDFDIRATFRVVLDDELTADTGKPLLTALWAVLDGWPRERKSRFVHFVTGSHRLPVPGMELLRIEMPFISIGAKDHKKTLGMLPQAHTCENILELPNYWQCMCALRGVDELGKGVKSAEFTALKQELQTVVEERFRLAVENCHSYGLDDGVGGGPVSFDGPASRPPRLSLTKRANGSSLESLGRGFSGGGVPPALPLTAPQPTGLKLNGVITDAPMVPPPLAHQRLPKLQLPPQDEPLTDVASLFGEVNQSVDNSDGGGITSTGDAIRRVSSVDEDIAWLENL